MQTLPIEIQHDIDQAFAGKVWAYVPVVTKHGSGLGVAVANEKGYCPVPWAHSERYDEIEAYSIELNASRGLSELQALDIIGSTMTADRK